MSDGKTKQQTIFGPGPTLLYANPVCLALDLEHCSPEPRSSGNNVETILRCSEECKHSYCAHTQSLQIFLLSPQSVTKTHIPIIEQEILCNRDSEIENGPSFLIYCTGSQIFTELLIQTLINSAQHFDPLEHQKCTAA